jgi:hypothetical protein
MRRDVERAGGREGGRAGQPRSMVRSWRRQRDFWRAWLAVRECMRGRFHGNEGDDGSGATAASVAAGASATGASAAAAATAAMAARLIIYFGESQAAETRGAGRVGGRGRDRRDDRSRSIEALMSGWGRSTEHRRRQSSGAFALRARRMLIEGGGDRQLRAHEVFLATRSTRPSVKVSKSQVRRFPCKQTLTSALSLSLSSNLISFFWAFIQPSLQSLKAATVKTIIL